MRINEVAREFEVSNREIIEFLESLGVQGKTHSSSLDGAILERVRERFAQVRRKDAMGPAPKPEPAGTANEPPAPPKIAVTKPVVPAPGEGTVVRQTTPTVADVREAFQRSMESRARSTSPAEESLRNALQSRVERRAAERPTSSEAATPGRSPLVPPAGSGPAGTAQTQRFRDQPTVKAQLAARDAIRRRKSQLLGGKAGFSLLPTPQEQAAAESTSVAAESTPPAAAVAEMPAAAPGQATPAEAAKLERKREHVVTPEELALQMAGVSALEEEVAPAAAGPIPETGPEVREYDKEAEEEQRRLQALLRKHEVPATVGRGERPAPPGRSLTLGRPTRVRTRKSIRRERRAKIAAEEEARVRREELESHTIRVHEATTVADIAHSLGVSPTELIGKLMGMGILATINQRLDVETIQILADDYNAVVEETSLLEDGLDLSLDEEEDSEESLVPRPPVVTVMGHVDHGKTKLLDAIRKTDVVATESGGITQHIGASLVHWEGGDITFLDTPGHEAFTSMRARGAQVTDIVVLVVAADDGVMPQTIEAINHARAGDTPIIVAINKIDKPEANPDRVMNQLAELGLVPEAWGGKTIYCPVSALHKTGIDNLLENILVQAQVMELVANPNRAARGTVIEARSDRHRGAVCTLLVQNGTLRVGDAIVVGVYSGRVRTMNDEHGQQLQQALPSVAVEVTGIGGVPSAGDRFYVVATDKEAKTFALKLQQIQRQRDLRRAQRVSLETFFDVAEGEGAKTLNLVIKGDVMGSVDALSDALTRLSGEKVSIEIVHRAAGAVTESDVLLASASDALIIAFKVRASPETEELARQENVEIRYYDVIYDATNDVQAAMLGMLEKKYEERILGRAEVRETFRIAKVGTIAGCFVTEGRIPRNAKARLVRDGAVLHDGKITSLKRFKDDAREVLAGLECGIGFESFQNIRVGDLIECYELIEIEQTLE